MCVQYNLLGHSQRVGKGGVETVRVKPAEVLHLSIVKIRIQVIYRHLIDQIGQRWGLFGGFIILPPALIVKQWKGEVGKKPNNTFWWTPRKSLWVSGADYLMKSVISCVWQSQMLLAGTYLMECVMPQNSLIGYEYINDTVSHRKPGKICTHVKVAGYLWHSNFATSWIGLILTLDMDYKEAASGRCSRTTRGDAKAQSNKMFFVGNFFWCKTFPDIKQLN